MADVEGNILKKYGRYPIEYNPKVHGPYHPGRNYGPGKFLNIFSQYSVLSNQESKKIICPWTLINHRESPILGITQVRQDVVI